jgi:hypothetical protein
VSMKRRRKSRFRLACGVAVPLLPALCIELTITFLTVVAALFLAIVHVFAGRLRFLDTIPRSRWLSLGAGISVAYVFMHLLPDLEEHQEVLGEAAGSALAFIEHHAYLVALFGLATFYGLERSAKQSRRREKKQSGQDVASAETFWLSTLAFALYNAFVGYLLQEQARAGLHTLLLFTIAMALHFVVNDYGLREHYKHRYARYGRWVLGVSVLAGSAISQFAVVEPAALSLLVAFLAGGIVLNVLKEELPDERESSFGAFAVGAVAYASLLLTYQRPPG